MQRTCREMVMHTSFRRQLAMTELLRHAKIVTDPAKLKYLKTRVANGKAMAEGDALRARR
jgi:hypothetical protein